MDDVTLSKIAQMVREADAKLVDVEGVRYTTTPLHDTRKPEPQPKPFELHTLSGLVEYLTSNRDSIDAAAALVHVESPTCVSVVGKLFGHFQQRYEYARCVPEVPSNLLQNWVDQESFVIWLQRGFADTEDLAKVIKLAGTLTDEAARTETDDGMTQKVTAKSGVSLVATAAVPNPVTLAPYRTFSEVEQPSSPFIFRVKSGPALALFEADGGAWRLAAMEGVKVYLDEHLEGWQVIA